MLIYLQITKYVTVRREELTLILIQMPAKGITLMFKPCCIGGTCRIAIYDGNESLPINRSNSFNLNDGEDAGYKPFTSMNATKISMGVTMVLGNNTKQNSSSSDHLIFSLQLFSTGCFYWNDIENAWSSDGCKVH